jgi:hypothetical protein
MLMENYGLMAMDELGWYMAVVTQDCSEQISAAKTVIAMTSWSKRLCRAKTVFFTVNQQKVRKSTVPKKIVDHHEQRDTLWLFYSNICATWSCENTMLPISFRLIPTSMYL